MCALLAGSGAPKDRALGTAGQPADFRQLWKMVCAKSSDFFLGTWMDTTQVLLSAGRTEGEIFLHK